MLIYWKKACTLKRVQVHSINFALNFKPFSIPDIFVGQAGSGIQSLQPLPKQQPSVSAFCVSLNNILNYESFIKFPFLFLR